MPLASPPPLPASTEVVVIGAGIAGISTAWYLQRLGIPVVVLEKGRVAGEQSSRNWGWIRKQGRDPAELELIVQSLGLWAEIAREIEDDIGFRIAGVTYLVEDEADAARYAAWLEHARPYQLDSRMLSVAETDALLPDNRAQHQGALHTPSDARAEPGKAVPAMARTLGQRGVPVIEACAVRTIERTGGRVSGVVTEHGRLACRSVVVAGGVWSRLLLRELGVALPQLYVISSVQRTTAAPLISETALASKAVAFRRRTDGGYTLARSGASRAEILPANLRYARQYLPVLKRDWRLLKFRLGRPFLDALVQPAWDGDSASPFERTRVFDPAPDHALLDDILDQAQANFPQLQGTRAVERWAGAIDVLPDEIPTLGPVPGVAGLLVATGFSGHGFGIGPAAGRVMAELAAGRPSSADLSAFRIDRFPSAVPH